MLFPEEPSMLSVLGRVGLLLLVVSLILISSCGRDEKPAELKGAEKEVSQQWAKVLEAIKKGEVDALKALCSSAALESNSDEAFTTYIEKSREGMKRSYATDYDISRFEFNEDKTEVTVTMRNEQIVMEFVKENDTWLLKEL
jgi:hypothetical protein